MENTIETFASLDIIRATDGEITTYKDRKTPTGKSKMQPKQGSYEEKVFCACKQFQTKSNLFSGVSLGVDSSGCFIHYAPVQRKDC